MGSIGRKPAFAPLRVDDLPDGAGSGLDADFLDGQNSTAFVLASSLGVVNGVATLDSAGKISAGQLPAITISSVSVVADNTERDNLTVETGDLAKVTSTGLTFVYDGSGWVEISSAVPVDSVNGFTGAVVLSTDDVAEGTTNQYYSSTLANADIDTRVDKSFVDALSVDAGSVNGASLNDSGLTASDLWSADKISSEIDAMVRQTFVFTASGGETSLTQDDLGNPLSYTVGFVELFVNGVRFVEGDDFTASDGSTVSLTSALNASDVVVLVALDVRQVDDVVPASGGAFGGAVNFQGGLSGTTGTLSGALSANTGTFAGDVTAQANLDVDGDLAFDSGFGSTATAYGVRAWVEFTGADGVITKSGNVDSITKLQTGDYNISIQNDMPDSDYFAVASDASGCNEITYRRRAKNNGSYRFQLLCAGSRFDSTVSLAIVR